MQLFAKYYLYKINNWTPIEPQYVNGRIADYRGFKCFNNVKVYFICVFNLKCPMAG